MKSYEHLFFDLDHTLWDFDTNSKATLIELFEKYDLAKRGNTNGDDFVSVYLRINEQKWDLYRRGLIDKQRLRRERFYETFQNFGIDDPDFSHQFEIEYIDTCPHRTALIPGSIELLDYLKDHYQLHIITNGFSEIQEIKLSKSGLKPYFDKIITSDEIGINKPAARIFVESMQMAKAERQNSLMIGDNLLADIVGARNCGIDQVYFNPEKISHEEKVTYEVETLLDMKSFL